MSDKLNELGIPDHEITPSVSIAVSGLNDHIDQLNRELNITKQQLENLQHLIDFDTVPSMPNRRAFLKRISWSIAMSKRYSGSSGVCVFHFNDFDTIEKIYGYQASNKAAAYVAEFLSGQIRDTDFFARIGESQFGTIMFFAEYSDIVRKCEAICNQLRSFPMKWNNGLINITLSFGVHAVTGADTPEGALLAATSAMHINSQSQKFEQINLKA